MDWLYEGRLTVYVILFATAFGCVFLARKQAEKERDPEAKRARVLLLIAVVVLLLFGCTYWLLDRLVETRREQITRRLNDMCVGVREKNVPRIFEHFADGFRFQQFDKKSFRDYVEFAARNDYAEDLVVWDIVFPDDSGKVVFKAKPKSKKFGDTPGYIVRAEFVEEAGGKWRLRKFDLFNPLVDTESALTLPSLRQ